MVCLLCDFKILLTVFNQSYNKPLPRQKPTAKTFSDTPLPGLSYKVWDFDEKRFYWASIVLGQKETRGCCGWPRTTCTKMSFRHVTLTGFTMAAFENFCPKII